VRRRLRCTDRQTVRCHCTVEQERHRRPHLHGDGGALAHAASLARGNRKRPDPMVCSQHGRGRGRVAAVRAGGLVILLDLILLLLAAGFIAWWSERLHPGLPRYVAIAALVLAGALLYPVATGQPIAMHDANWYASLRLAWIPRFGIEVILAMDG